MSKQLKLKNMTVLAKPVSALWFSLFYFLTFNFNLNPDLIFTTLVVASVLFFSIGKKKINTEELKAKLPKPLVVYTLGPAVVAVVLIFLSVETSKPVQNPFLVLAFSLVLGSCHGLMVLPLITLANNIGAR